MWRVRNELFVHFGLSRKIATFLVLQTAKLKASGDSAESDGGVPRRAIAMGEAPIAARESVVKYQMAQRENSFTDFHNFR